MRIRPVALSISVLFTLAACATAPGPAVSPDSDFSWLRTPRTFQAFVTEGNAYTTQYMAPTGWRETASRNSFVYWNAVMTVRTGNRCFTLEKVKSNEHVDIGAAPANPAPGDLTIRQPETAFEFTSITRLYPDCTAPDAIDARDYLSRTSRPEQAPRKQGT